MIARRARILSLVVVLGAGLSSPWPPGALHAKPGRDLAVATPETVGVSSERLKRLDAGIKGLVTDGRLAGAVTLLTRHGKTVHVGVHGVKDIRSGAPMTRDSIFRIYSMTKPVTGVAMLMLYEEGKWRLDDPVSRFIPEFGALTVWVGENPDGTPKTEPARRSMTMRELMTHSGGLAYGLVGGHAVDKLYLQAGLLDPRQPLQALIGGIAALPLVAQPGTRWSYSVAVDVQGYLVEKLSGQSFADFLRTRLFEPLKMTDTGFYVPKDKLSRLALVHGEDATGKLTPPDDSRGDPTQVPVAAFGGHGLFSTAADYARFCEMLLGGGELGGTRILAPRTVAMWRTNHLAADSLKTVRAGTGWGLGPQVVMDAAAAGEPYSDGSANWWGIGGTWFWIDPEKDFAFIGMIQHAGRTLLGVTQIHGYSRNLVYQAILD
jgi:CubicO group peptidase (beta-lactamase class C family)